MNTLMPSTPQTVGQLLGLTIAMYRSHAGLFLRTAAVFLFPVALLTILFVKNIGAVLLVSLILWPVAAMASVSLIALCNDSLHGRPFAFKAAAARGLHRLLPYLGMNIVTSAVYGAAGLVLTIPFWLGFAASDIPFAELRRGFLALLDSGEVDGIAPLLPDLVGPIGAAFCCLSVLLMFFLFYLSSRWLVAQAALMVEETGPLESLGRSWNLSRRYVLRTMGYTFLLSLVVGLLGGLIGLFFEFAVVRVIPSLDQAIQPGFNGAVSSLLSIVTTPFYICATVLYYFDLRVRREKYNWEEG